MDKQETKSQSKENSNTIWQIYNVNDFIDTKDNQGDWRVGYIVEKNQNSKIFKIRFDGWASKHDQLFLYNSLKLLDFRTLVIGYTGQKVNPGTRSGWKFNQKINHDKIKILVDYQNYRNKSAWQINQWYRGHNYFYVDFLMTQKYDTREQFNAVMQYFIKNIQMVLWYLSKIDPQFKQYYRSQQISQQSHLVNSQSAFVNAYYEIMDTLYIISGSYSRFQKFFTDNRILLKNYLKTQSDSIYLPYQQKIQQEVDNCKGFDIFRQLIDDKLSNVKCVIPFLFIKSLALLYKGLSRNLPLDQRINYYNKLVDITKQNTKKLDDKYIKNISKSHVSQLLETLKMIFDDTKHAHEIRIWALKQQIKFYEKLIYCPYFDKKLKGILGLQELIQKNKMGTYCNQLIQILTDQKIFDSLFSFDNAEIIRQSVQVCKTLQLNQMFPSKIAFRIWELREGKHQAALKQIYSLIAFLPIRSKYKNYQFVKELFQEISKLPKQQWDQDYIKMIQQYSLNAINQPFQKSHSFTYGLHILYENAIIKKSDFAINSFIELFSKFHKIELTNQYINQFLTKIQNNQQSYVYIIFFKKIINENDNKLSQISQNASNILIKDLLKNSNDKYQKIAIRFELLNQILKLTNTHITTQQFMKLWVEYENKENKKALYNWILYKKQNGNYEINDKIQIKTCKQIFQKVWINNSNNYDFQNICQQQLNIFIQLFKNTNADDKKLKKINKIIKVSDRNLKGFQYIWKAFQSVKNNAIAQNLAQLIVQIFMTPTKNSYKQSWVTNLIKQFSDKIKSASLQHDIHKIKRLLIIPIKIIQRDQQIFKTYYQKNDKIKQFKVTNISNKQQKCIKFNMNGLAYDFKRLVSQKFNIPFKKCKISHKNDVINYENYFEQLYESFSNCFTFKLQIIDQQTIIKKILNDNLETFFNLLDHTQLQQVVWEIIQQLPIAQNFSAKLQKSQKSWEEINNSSIYKQLYIMKVMKYMSESWWENFCKNPGFLNLTKKFQRTHSKTKIQRQYLKVLCQNIQKCLSNINIKKFNIEGIDLQQFSLTILKSLNQLLNNNNKQQNKKQQNKKYEIHIQIISSIFKILKFFQKNVNLMQLLIQKFTQNRLLLSNGLFLVKNLFIRKQFIKRLIQIKLTLSQQNLQTYIQIIYAQIFKSVISYPHPQQTPQYFQYAAALIDIIKQKQFISFKQHLVQEVQLGLSNQQPVQHSSTIPYHLVGFLTLMKKLVDFCSVQQKLKLTKFLLEKCLIPHSADADILCKCKESKTSALQLLEILIYKDVNSQKTLKQLSSLHKNANWRKFNQWNINPLEKIKSINGYVGLKNLGCTCYINSFLQQIFMIENLCKLIIECQDPLQTKQDQKQINNVLYQLKKMFLNLLYSQKKYYVPNQFCYAFKNYQGMSINVTQQMDIDQFSGILFDKLQNQIKGTPYQNMIKDFFGGVFSNEIICKSCPHFSSTQQSFLSISLNVKNKKNIHQSFDTMIKGDTLDGDNAYFCERCNKKVSAIKRVCLKKLPDYLILTLKRFQFDFQIMKKLKVNDYCQFPIDLNLKQYSQQYLHRKQKPDKFQDEQIIPDYYFQYTLRGVVIHVGSADSGHYYSLIKEKGEEGKWLQFNDTNVRPFDIKKLPQQAYGGYMKTMQLKQRIKNAYMLIYQRKKKLVNHDEHVQENKNWTESPKCDYERQQIKQQNSKQKIQNILFSSQYRQFASNLINKIQSINSQIAKQILKYTILVYLTVIIRQKQQQYSYKYLLGLNKVLINYPQISQWVVKIFTAQNSLMEFFKNNPKKQIKKLLANWIVTLANRANPQLKNSLIDGIIAFIAHHRQNQSQLCQLLYFLMNSFQASEYMMKKHIITVLLQNILGVQKSQLARIQKEQNLIQSAQQQIGKQILIQKPTSFQHLKKLKLNQQASYVWGILNLLTKLSTYNNKKLTQLLNASQIQLFSFFYQKLYKFLQDCKNKFIINNLCQLLTHLATNDKNLTDKLIRIVQQGFKQEKVKKFRQFFILLNHLMKIDDQFSQHRLVKGYDALIKGLKINQKFSNQCNVFQQWIVKILKKNYRLQQVFRGNDTYHAYLIELPSKKHIIQKQHTKTILQQQQQMVCKFHGVKMLRTKKLCEQFTQNVVKFYTDLINGAQIQPSQWQSDEDLVQTQLAIGQKIGYFDRQKMQFIQGIIQQKQFKRLQISANNIKMTPVWQDDDKITSNKYQFKDCHSDNQLADSENTTELQCEQDNNLDHHIE